MINPSWAFEIPAAFLTQHNIGQVVRYGGILKDVGTGQIVAHLQETAVLQNLIGQGVGMLAGGPVGLASAAVSAVGAVAGVVQNEQIKSRLSALQASVQGMQTMTQLAAAASVVGVGVTAVSTALVLKRLGGIEGTLGKLEQSVDGIGRVISDLHLKRDLIEAQTALDRMGEVGSWANAEPMVRRSEEQLHGSFSKLSHAVEELAQGPSLQIEMLSAVIAALGLVGAAQIHALMWLEEQGAARKRSEALAQSMSRIAWHLPPDRLRVASGDAGLELSHLLREVRDQTGSLPSLLDLMAQKGIGGQDYLERLSGENAEPLLVLAA